MTMICDGPERVVLGVGPPAVPSRMSREVWGADRAAGARGARGAPDASGATRSAADCRRKSRRFTPAIVTGGLRHTVTPALSLIHISEPTRLGMISYAVFCLKK